MGICSLENWFRCVQSSREDRPWLQNRELSLAAAVARLSSVTGPLLGSWRNSSYFFPRGHGNESCNVIGSSRGPDFPISDHGHGNGGKQRG